MTNPNALKTLTKNAISGLQLDIKPGSQSDSTNRGQQGRKKSTGSGKVNRVGRTNGKEGKCKKKQS
jgi:hypothetical protein